MKTLWIVPILAACASPAPEFMGASRSETTYNGRNYTVFYTQNRAEVIRHGYAAPGEHQGIRADMATVIANVTGCRLNARSLQGDSGEMRASIRCPKK